MADTCSTLTANQLDGECAACRGLLATPRRGELATADYADVIAAAERMNAAGWTIDNALAHLYGECDVTVCSCRGA